MPHFCAVLNTWDQVADDYWENVFVGHSQMNSAHLFLISRENSGWQEKWLDFHQEPFCFGLQLNFKVLYLSLGLVQAMAVLSYSCHVLIFKNICTARNSLSVLLACVTEISWRLHDFNKWKELVPGCDKLYIAHNFVASIYGCIFILSP